RPYYRDAGQKYVRDALEMASVKDVEVKLARQKIANLKKKELSQPMSLGFAWSENGMDFKKSGVDLHVTSEKEYDLFFRILRKGINSGYPVVYIEPGNAEL